MDSDTMKLGIIADIHADHRALTKALDRWNKDEGVDAIVCAGDVVGKGPMPNQAAALMGYHKIPNVLGNHDQRSLEKGFAKSGGQLVALNQEALDYLGQTPATQTWSWEGVRVMAAHGTPSCNRTYVFAQDVPERLHQDLAVKPPDVLILGHTHKPMCIRVGQTLVVNPGSVCLLKRQDSHTCAILELPSLDFRVLSL